MTGHTAISGAIAPVPTPFDELGRPDLEALGRHLDWLSAEGLDGVLVLGSNGEFPSLTLAERERVAAAASTAGAGLARILNVGSCALDEALALSRRAAELGYDAVLCPPPFYLPRPPVAGVAAFLGRVVDQAALPVLLYHIPRVTGVPLSDELLAALGGRPNLAGVKDSSGDPGEVGRLAAPRAGWTYLVGHDRLVSHAMAAGASGSITAAASVAPRLVRAVQRDPLRQADLDRVRTVLERFGLVPAAKAILRRNGFGAYRCRPPLLDLSDEQVDALVAEISGCPLA